MSLTGDLPDPTRDVPAGGGAHHGGGSLTEPLPDPTKDVPIRQGPVNPVTPEASGPALRMEVDLDTINAVIRGYQDDIERLLSIRNNLYVVASVENPGEEEASETYCGKHRGSAESLRAAVNSHIDQLRSRLDMLSATVRQYANTDVDNRSNFREGE